MRSIDSGFRARCRARNLFVGVILVAAACSDQTSSSLVAAKHALLSLSPRFALVDGGPSIQLSRVDAWMILPVRDSLFQTANFVDGSAPLVFDVPMHGESEDVTLAVTGFDSKGVEVYRARQAYTIKPGDNSDLAQPVFTYTAPDANIASLVVSPKPMTVDAGSTSTLTASGFGPNQQAITPLNVGWTSRNTNIVTVDANGVVTGVARGQTYVVARTATNKTDSALVTVQGLGITPDKVEKLPNGTQQFTVSAARGTVTWTVNNVAGGNATFGTVSTSGFYTAPATVPTPASFNVCAVQATPAATACAAVTINPVPTSGQDVVVFNDINMFDGTGASDVNNQKLFFNLVSFTGVGARASQKGVMLYGGHQAAFQPSTSIAPFMTGYTVTTVSDTALTSIASNYKVIFLWTPTVAFTNEEINVMKQFSGEGGRIVFIGEHVGSYGTGIPIENAFLKSMGAQMTNAGGRWDCSGEDGFSAYPVLPASRLVTTHQVMTGLTGLTVACASELIPGPNDFVLFRNFSDGAHVLGGVAKIDVTPLPSSGNLIPKVTRVPSKPVAPTVSEDPAGPMRKPLR